MVLAALGDDPGRGPHPHVRPVFVLAHAQLDGTVGMDTKRHAGQQSVSLSSFEKITQSFCKAAGKAQWIENVTSLSTMVLAVAAPEVVKTAWWVAWMYADVPSRMPLPLLVEIPYALGLPTTEIVPPYPAPAKSVGVPRFSSSFRYSLGARDVIGVSSYRRTVVRSEVSSPKFGVGLQSSNSRSGSITDTAAARTELLFGGHHGTLPRSAGQGDPLGRPWSPRLPPSRFPMACQVSGSTRRKQGRPWPYLPCPAMSDLVTTGLSRRAHGRSALRLRSVETRPNVWAWRGAATSRPGAAFHCSSSRRSFAAVSVPPFGQSHPPCGIAAWFPPVPMVPGQKPR